MGERGGEGGERGKEEDENEDNEDGTRPEHFEISCGHRRWRQTGGIKGKEK